MASRNNRLYKLPFPQISADASVRSGTFLTRAIEYAGDHVTIEETLADMLAMTPGGDDTKGRALTCLNVCTFGEFVVSSLLSQLLLLIAWR